GRFLTRGAVACFPYRVDEGVGVARELRRTDARDRGERFVRRRSALCNLLERRVMEDHVGRNAIRDRQAFAHCTECIEQLAVDRSGRALLPASHLASILALARGGDLDASCAA